jgi:Leucine-rich repeat (LRR) protein
LKRLILERCHLENFVPNALSSELTEISLEGNKIECLDVEFGEERPGFFSLKDVFIKTFNLSSNQFREFPFEQLKSSSKLM